MSRLALILILGCCLAWTGAAAGDGVRTEAGQHEKKVTLRWFGQSFFEAVSSDGVRVVFDPHAIEAFGRISLPADIVLISHFHTDHAQLDAIENRVQARVIPGLKAEGRRTEWNIVDETIRGVRIRSVGVYHDHLQGLERGKNAIFIVEMDGLRIVHLGDLGHLLTDEHIKAIGPVDVLMIPVGGVYTINGTEARKVVDQLAPRHYILPMHYGLPIFDQLLPIDEFLDGQKRDNVRRMPGNTLNVVPGVRPAEPIIAVLHWK